jgi:hypothetical protein
MRENRLSGSEGGGTLIGSPYPYRKASGPIFSQLLPPWATLFCPLRGCPKAEFLALKLAPMEHRPVSGGFGSHFCVVEPAAATASFPLTKAISCRIL